jgi:hypothetical protein
MRSLRCRIDVPISPVAVAAGFGVFATPLVGVEFVGRCVMGLVPWDHALGAGGFLRRVSRCGRHNATVRSSIACSPQCELRPHASSGIGSLHCASM